MLKIPRIPKFIRETLLAISEINSWPSELESTLKALGAIGIIEVNPSSVVAGILKERNLRICLRPKENPAIRKALCKLLYSGKKAFQDNLIRVVVSLRTASEILNGSSDKSRRVH